MRSHPAALVLATSVACVFGSFSTPRHASADEGASTASAPAKSKTSPAKSTTPKPWCAPEVTELSDHVCYFEGGEPADGRKTLVIYLHGALAQTPGFFYMQQRAMAIHAKKHGFTVLMPTGPSDGFGFVWPTGQAAQKDQEPGILAGIAKARGELEKRVGHRFDETFVVGFSSGAYYGSSLAVRNMLDVDGYIVLAGGSSWVKPDAVSKNKRAPVFVGVSAADPQTAGHSRSFAGALAGMGWPFKVEERNAGHMVDWTFMAHGITWLRSRAHGGKAPAAAAIANVSATTTE
jgi:predicted esterase